MKVLFALAAAASITASDALAGGTSGIVCQIPTSCVKVVGASFEISQSKTTPSHVKLTCEDADGNTAAHVSWSTSWAGLFSPTRVSTGSTRILFKKTGGQPDRMVCTQ